MSFGWILRNWHIALFIVSLVGMSAVGWHLYQRGGRDKADDIKLEAAKEATKIVRKQNEARANRPDNAALVDGMFSGDL